MRVTPSSDESDSYQSDIKHEQLRLPPSTLTTNPSQPSPPSESNLNAVHKPTLKQHWDFEQFQKIQMGLNEEAEPVPEWAIPETENERQANAKLLETTEGVQKYLKIQDEFMSDLTAFEREIEEGALKGRGEEVDASEQFKRVMVGLKRVGRVSQSEDGSEWFVDCEGFPVLVKYDMKDQKCRIIGIYIG